jgi:adenylate cyclase
VIARNSSFSYKGTSPDIRQVGRELGVRYVLEGAVRKAGNRLRITAQLIDAATGNHHWAERYDCEATDIFAIQDEITEKVVGSLEPQLLLAEGGMARHKTPIDLAAWGYVARAYVHFARRSKDDLQAAVILLERAIECDPQYARAHAYLAQVQVAMAYQGGLADRDLAFEAAASSARRAIELDPNDPGAHYAKGLVASLKRQHAEAFPSLVKAVELNPNFALAHSRLGTILSFLGRPDEGIEHTSRALRISPRDPQKYGLLNAHCIALFVAKRYAEAITAAEAASQERSGFAPALRTLTAARALHGDIAGAQTALRELQLAQPGITLAWVDGNVDAPDAVRTRLLEGLRVAGLPE